MPYLCVHGAAREARRAEARTQNQEARLRALAATRHDGYARVALWLRRSTAVLGVCVVPGTAVLINNSYKFYNSYKIYTTYLIINLSNYKKLLGLLVKFA